MLRRLLGGEGRLLLRETLRRGVLVARTVEGFHERDHLVDLLGRELEREDLLAQPGVRVAALVVVLDDLLEGLERAVVHVGGVLRDVAQRRRLEGAGVLFLVADLRAADVGEGAVESVMGACGGLGLDPPPWYRAGRRL